MGAFPDDVHVAKVDTLEQAFILWRRVDTQGHDACRLEQVDDGFRLSGTAVFVEDKMIGAISYDVHHDADWTTQSALVSGWLGSDNIEIEIARQADGSWHFNGDHAPQVQNASDIDLGLTPATNTTVIRRLRLAEGQSQPAMTAWLDPSDWQLKPLEQIYFRRAAAIYEYSSPAHGFSAELTVKDFGFVTNYPGIWLSE